jgi:hypothetical protein
VAVIEYCGANVAVSAFADPFESDELRILCVPDSCVRKFSGVMLRGMLMAA